MRLLRIIRSRTVYVLVILAVVIYALMWLFRVNEEIPLDGMTRNVAIAAIAVILWGRIRNLMIRLHPLDDESVARDRWIVQLYPRLLVIGILWLAAEAQPVELRVDFAFAALAACLLLLTRALWIFNVLFGPGVALFGGVLAFVAEIGYDPVDHRLAIAGGLLVLLGLEAVIHALFYRTDDRIMNHATRHGQTAKVEKAHRKREEREVRKRAKALEGITQRELFEFRARPNSRTGATASLIPGSPVIDEIWTQIEVHGLEDEIIRKEIYPGVDFPFEAIPIHIRKQLLWSKDLRHSDYRRPTHTVPTGPKWGGLKRWTVDDLAQWKREWEEEQNRSC